ncbi:unnamed protein product [Effrenium voratum]|uniref:J domain-containing protein n=1 Tax=Effrenium voratum TaxID=2562239 RepID=A0AA36N1E0_9DINO|nr:unnamed protein product [Effrenium voratum]
MAPLDDAFERIGNSGDGSHAAQGLERLTAWLGDAEANLIMAVTSVGLPATIARELSVFHGAESVALRNRLYFPWRGEGRCPTVHGASSLLTVFALASGQDLAELRSAKDTHAAFADFVEQAARALRSVLPPYMVLCAESKDDPGANPPGRKISFTGQCRVGHRGAEQIALGDVDWALLKQALRGGVQRATGWVLEPRSAEAEVRVVAFFGDNHVALGVEVKEGETHQAPSILWSRLPRPGMQTNIAGAMAALAAEAVVGDTHAGESIVVDPTCGMGTLLLAAARAWPQVCSRPLRLVGREADPGQLQNCMSNFVACQLDASDIRLGDGRGAAAFADLADGSVDALLCDLPSGVVHKASSDFKSYSAFLQLAERIVRPGGRCILLSERHDVLRRTISDSWKEVASYVLGRGEANRLQFLLVALERGFTYLCARGQGAIRQEHRRRATDLVRRAVSEAVATEDLAPPVDYRESPWEVLHEAYQAEGRRCWGPGFDGKVPGYIAECLRRDHPASEEEPPFRRRWLKRREEEKEETTDPYKTLGVAQNATLKEIRRAYIRLAKETHPDTGGDSVEFQDVLVAYRILSDDERRKEFDKSGCDTGDVPEEERKVRLPHVEVLRNAVMNHREVKWDPDMANLAGQVGTVQFDDPEFGITEVVVWVSKDEGYSAWVPSSILIHLNPDGVEQPYQDYQQALVKVNQGALMRPESPEKQYTRTVQYTLGWAAFDSGVKSKPDPLRDAAFAQVFFKRDREAEDRGVVLDIGCGHGSGSRLFASSRKFDLVFGLDINSTALYQARMESEDEEMGPEQGLFLLRGDAQELPFRDQQVDYVWWSFGWHEAERPEEVLRGIYRILKVGGRVAIATAAGKPLAKEIMSKLGELGFSEMTMYPPRSKVFLNYATKPR